MEDPEVATTWTFKDVGIALRCEQASFSQKSSFDTTFLLPPYKHTLQADSATALTKAGKKKRRREELEESASAELGRKRVLKATKKARATVVFEEALDAAQLPLPPTAETERRTTSTAD